MTFIYQPFNRGDQPMNPITVPEDMNRDRRRFLGAAAKCFVAFHLGRAGSVKAQSTATVKLPVEGDLPSTGGATTWLNSQPLTARSLRGSVVIVNFWTF